MTTPTELAAKIRENFLNQAEAAAKLQAKSTAPQLVREVLTDLNNTKEQVTRTLLGIESGSSYLRSQGLLARELEDALKPYLRQWAEDALKEALLDPSVRNQHAKAVRKFIIERATSYEVVHAASSKVVEEITTLATNELRTELGLLPKP